MKKILFAVLTFFVSIAHPKVTIYAHYFSNPEFIEFQDEGFKKFLEDEYEYIIYDDSSKPEVSDAIFSECVKRGIKYIKIPKWVFTKPYLPCPPHGGLTNPSVQCANVLQYVYETYIKNSSGLNMLIDNDMFLINPLHIEKYMEGYSLAGQPQRRMNENTIIDYLLPALLIFNVDTMPNKDDFNVNLGFIDDINTDTGGFIHYYLKNNPYLKLRNINWHYPSSGVEDPAFRFVDKTWNMHFLLDKKFLHFVAGSNWNNKEYYTEKLTDFYHSFYNHLQSN